MPRVPESPPRISLRYKKWQDLHLRQPFPFFLLSSSITHTLQRPRPTSTTLQSQFHSQLSTPTFKPPQKSSTCLQRVPPRRSPPQRPQQPRLPLRRRMPERRLPQLARRRSAPRPARRLTLHTSTKVRFKLQKRVDFTRRATLLSRPLLTHHSSQAGPPRYWYLQPCHVHPELLRQW